MSFQKIIFLRISRLILAVFFTAWAILSVILVVYYEKNLNQLESYILDSMTRKGNSIVKNHSTLAIYYTQNNSPSSILKLIKETVNNDEDIIAGRYWEKVNAYDASLITYSEKKKDQENYQVVKGGFNEISKKIKAGDKNLKSSSFNSTTKSHETIYTFFIPVFMDHKLYGYLEYDASDNNIVKAIENEKNAYLKTTVIVFVCLGLTLFLTIYLIYRKVREISIEITEPIKSLTSVANDISNGFYDTKIEHDGDAKNEFSLLSSSFNKMRHTIKDSLYKINRQNKDLKEKEEELLNLNLTLEEKVKERTNRIKHLQSEMLKQAHNAGISEVVVNILHNIGNVINSINTANYRNREIINSSKHEIILQSNNKLKQETKDLESASIPELIKIYDYLAKQWSYEINTIGQNQNRIYESIEIIKNIITEQQASAKLGIFKEEYSLNALIIQIITPYNEEFHNIIHFKADDDVVIYNERNKTHQIVMNLVLNAIQATQQQNDGVININLSVIEKNAILSISDNGVGIEKEILFKIFQSCFTTKEKGNGFGLHSCANFIKEMGGSIDVHSKGINQGAEFIIKFPLNRDL